MPTPEQRFEVPPEYADVYERAYRRAYDEGPGSRPDELSAGAASPTARPGIPLQRAGRGRAADAVRPVRGHRATGPRRPTLLLVGAASVGLLLLLVTAFALGRSTADSVVAGPRWVPESTSSPATSHSGGTARPAQVRDAATSCTALPQAGGRTAYAVENVLDDNPSTAWRCDGLAVGQELTFTLAPSTRVVQVGIVPGLARDDPSTGADDYRLNNRITRVSWAFGNGTIIDQRLGDDATDRSLRTVIVPPTTTGQVRLRILGVSRGKQNATTISTVQILATTR